MEQIFRSGDFRHNDSMVSFLIVGPAELCHKIFDALHESAKEREWKIAVHQSESIKDVTKAKITVATDFIIFAFNMNLTETLSEVETNISLIDEQFIISGTACLVNCLGESNIFGIFTHKSKEIQAKYNISLLSVNISKPESCLQLGHRILNLTDAVLGITSGIPTITYLTKN